LATKELGIASEQHNVSTLFFTREFLTKDDMTVRRPLSLLQPVFPIEDKTERPPF
jgi:hypothetical protein